MLVQLLPYQLGMLAYRTNSVRASVFVHAVHNLVAVGYGVYASELSANLSGELVGWSMIGLIASLQLAGLMALVFFMRARRPDMAVERSLASSLAA